MMRKTLYYNLILGYIIFGAISFIFVFMFTRKLTYDSDMNSIATTAFNISGVISEMPESSMMIKKNLQSQAKANASTIWIIDRNGKILVSTDNSMGKIGTIYGFDATDFNDGEYTIGYFYNTLNEKSMTVLRTDYLSNGNRVYIVTHIPMSTIYSNASGSISIMIVTLAVVFLFSFVILIVFTMFIYKPIKQISHAASEFAKGNLRYKVLVVNTDDELGRLAASLNFMAAQLNTHEEDQKKFIANISHDFRSPLTSIKGYVEAMKDGTIPHEQQDKYLDIVLFETSRLSKLTENLLTMNAWDQNDNKLDLTVFDVATEVRQVIDVLSNLSNNRKIKFKLYAKAKSYDVLADKGKIQQVIYNLIDNAIKFSENNSNIYIRIYGKADKVFVSIRDTGIGIPEDCIPKIWDRFYKTDLSRGKDKTGTGLGLAIAKDILQYHNESIQVASKEGVGTEFIFSLSKAPKK